MTDSAAALPEAIECPLCLGKGKLSRTEVLERLGMKDFTRVAQLSAEEAIRLVLKKEKDAEQARWAKFDAELARRVAEVTGKHNAELQKIQAEKAELEAAQGLAHKQRETEVMKARTELEAALNAEKAKANDLARQGKDYLQEIGGLRDRNQVLEAEMAKVARVGKKEELDFAAEARSWPGVWIGEKLPRNGDYLMAFADAAGNPLEPSMVVDNKDKATVAEADVRKLVRDARERKLTVAVLLAHEESQLRQADRQRRWAQEDGIWVLRTARAWLPRDLEVLRPVFERMRAEGPDFLQRNAALADEVRRTLADVDEIEGQLRKAESAIEKAQALTAKYRARLSALCDSAAAGGEMMGRRRGNNRRSSARNGDANLEHQQANQQEESA